MDARFVAVRVLTEVFHSHRHLDEVLASHQALLTDTRDKSLAQELSYGVMRWYFRLHFIAQKLLSKPLQKKHIDIELLILCGLYQISFLRIPDHAAISATVETARKLGKPWATGMINAVLRRYLRERQDIDAIIEQTQTARYAHPQWIINRLHDQWPEYLDKILEANNQHPPLHLRVNTTRQSREEYLQLLEENRIDALSSTIVDRGILIKDPVDVERLPGFAAGCVSVQDFGAQMAAPLMKLEPGLRVLDACAAPGGKTGHIAEIMDDTGELVAVEKETRRFRLLQDTMKRLGVKALLAQADLLDTAAWWDGIGFDRILLDAPCTATGVIRRNPDIKVLRTGEHISPATRLQQRLLETLWPMLRPGGRLVYVTCSMLREECDDQIESFSNRYDDVLPVTAEIPLGAATRFGRQTIPGKEDTDGFYYAVLEKGP